MCTGNRQWISKTVNRRTTRYQKANGHLRRGGVRENQRALTARQSCTGTGNCWTCVPSLTLYPRNHGGSQVRAEAITSTFGTFFFIFLKKKWIYRNILLEVDPTYIAFPAIYYNCCLLFHELLIQGHLVQPVESPTADAWSRVWSQLDPILLLRLIMK